MTNETTKRIAKTALMIALIFVCTFTIKLPNPATGGYTHMGDCMAFLAVLVLGKKDGALAAGLGAALSDLLTGAMIWVLPTFIFKFIMGYIMGVVLEKGNNEKLDWIVGASLGGLFQCFAYTLFKIPLFTAAVAFASVPRLLAQTIMGLVIYAIVANVLAKSKVLSLQGAVA